MLSRLTSDDLAGGILELEVWFLALLTLLCALSSVTEFNHCNKEAHSLSCSVTVVFGFRQYNASDPGRCL